MARKVNFFRASEAYLQQNASRFKTETPRYDPGKWFGTRALRIEPGVSNLLTANQSDVETNSVGFTALNSPTSGARDTLTFFRGAASFNVVCSATAFSGYMVDVSTSTQGTYVGRMRIRGNPFTTYVANSLSYALRIVYTDASVDAAGGTLTPSTLWQDCVTAPVTSNPGKTVSKLELTFRDAGASAMAGKEFWVDTLQIEQNDALTTWQLGGVTRAGERCTVKNDGLFHPTEGTIEAWVYADTIGGIQTIWDTRHVLGIGSEQRCFLIAIAGVVQFTYWNGSILRTIVDGTGSTLSAATWTHIAASWGPGGGKLYRAGNLVGSHADVPVLTTPSRIMLGCRVDNLEQWNGLLGGIRFTYNRARTNAQILATFTGNVQFTEDTTGSTVFTFDGTLRSLLSSYAMRIAHEPSFLVPVTVTASSSATDFLPSNSADWEFPLRPHRTTSLVEATLLFDFGVAVNFGALFIGLTNWSAAIVETSYNNSFWTARPEGPIECAIDEASQVRKCGVSLNASGRYLRLTITAQVTDDDDPYFETPLVICASDLDAFDVNPSWGATIGVEYPYQDNQSGAHDEVQAEGKQYVTMQVRADAPRGTPSLEWKRLAALGAHKKFLVFADVQNPAESYLMRLDGNVTWEENSGHNAFSMTWREHTN